MRAPLRWIGSSLLSAALTGLPVGATDLPEVNHWGAQVLVASPRQNLHDLTPCTGFGGSLFVERALTLTTVIQTRFDYVSYRPGPTATGTQPPAPVSVSPSRRVGNTASLGVDIRKYLPYPGCERLFVLAGMAAVRHEIRSTELSFEPDPDGNPVATPVLFNRKTSVKPGLALGAGCDFGRGCLLTVRYTHMASDGLDYTTLESGLSLRF